MEKLTNPYGSTHTVVIRTDTNEYLSRFEFWDRDSLQWSADLNEAFLFQAQAVFINARMVLEWLDDPMNRRLQLKSAGALIRGRKLVVGEWFEVNAGRVA